MSPRRNARRLKQVLPSRAAAPVNRQSLRVVAMPGAASSGTHEAFVSETATPEGASAGSLAQTARRLVEVLALMAKQAVQVAIPAARGAWNWLSAGAGVKLRSSKTRRLRLAETLSLGDKRFVSLVEVDGQTFLIGASSSGVSLLAECQGKRADPAFSSVMEQARWPEKESA